MSDDGSVTVYEWYDRDKHRTHKFPGTDIHLYPDDTMLRVASKIAVVLGKTTIPYLWYKNRSLLFTVRSTGWKGYSPHPWKAKDIESAVVKPIVTFNTSELLGKLRVINVAFKDAVPFPNNEHYFPTIDQNIPTVDTIRREDAILQKLLSLPSTTQGAQSGNVFSHVVFHGLPQKFHFKDSGTFLSDLYERFHATEFVPFVQWMDDGYRVLYKLWKHHRIPHAHLAHWTSADRLPKVATSLTCYSPVGGDNNNVYARIFVSLDGKVVLTYHMDIREKVDWSNINRHKDKVFEWLKKYTGISYEVREGDISVKTEINTDVSILELSSVVGKVYPIFHLITTKAGYMEALYKRASNYKDNVQLSDYIQSKIDMGNSIPEIIEMLVDMGIPHDEAVAGIEIAEGTGANNGMNKKIQTGTIIKVAKIGFGIKVNIVNCASLEELDRAMLWLRSCIQYSKTAVVKKPPKTVNRPPSPIQQEIQPASVSSSTSQQPQSKTSSLNSDDLAFLSDGGAIGKEHQRYFLNMLQDADPAVFNNSDINYARTCQASSFHQPVVVSKEEHAKMVEEGYGNAIDSTIVYGSDASKQNVYFCPRIWCPAMKRPITYDMYVQNGNKCPSGEEAKLMYQHAYWNNSPDTKHYIGFHTKKTKDGLCLPCCYIKPLAEKKEGQCVAPKRETAVSSKTKSSEKEPAVVKDAYIMTQVAPLPEGRSGNIPQILHEIITPNINFQLCTKTLSTQECPVRHGIIHKNDSLMNAIAYVLGKTSKEELIKWMKEKLDPLTFLSLENGEIVATFSDASGPIPRENAGMVKEVKRRLQKHKSYADIFGIADVKILDTDEFRLSRELQFYIAWIRFFKYLSSDEMKSPHHLYDLLKKLGYLLVIWDKTAANAVDLRCPLYSSASHLARDMGSHRNTVMLIYENGVYEPIELRKRTNDGIPVIDTKYTTTIDDVMQSCDMDADGVMDVYNRVISMERWATDMLRDGSPFTFNTAVLSPDLRITHIFTRGLLLITLPNRGLPIGMLPQLLKDTNIKRVLHHEDIAGKVLRMRLLKQDCDFYLRKLQSIGLGYTSGTPQLGEITHITSIYTVPAVTVAPLIVTRGNDVFDRSYRGDAKLDAEFIQLQRMIGKMFLQHYDTLVAPTLKMPRKDRIALLSNTFPAYPNKSRLRVVLGEIPLEHGKLAIMDWMRGIGYDDTFPFYDDKVHETRVEWIFSQRVVEDGIPSHLIRPVSVHGSRPRNEPPSDDHAVRTSYMKPDPSAQIRARLPAMLSEAEVDKKKLPSKWTQIRNYEWNKYDVYHAKTYSKERVRELVEWIAVKVGVPVVWGDVQYRKWKYVTPTLRDEPSIMTVLQDPSIAKEFATKLGKSFKTIKQLWERGLSQASAENVKMMWDEILKSGRLWPGDIDFLAVARLMDVTILILHRSKYGKTGADAAVVRGDVADLATSSSLYAFKYAMTHIESRPICILYKDTTDDHAVYSPLVDQKGVFLYSSMFDCPSDIKKLVEFHITKRTSQ